MNKKENGQYFTTNNPFGLTPFQTWLKSLKNLSKMKVIEPFAGSNNIVEMFNALNIKLNWTSYDLDPKHKNIIKNNSIENYPKNYDIAITNPPYLAKNSAKRMKLKFPNTKYDDLYKLALDVMITNTQYVVAIIPESFITAELFHKQLVFVISLEMKMFDDTECPVCLAVFDNTKKETNFKIYKNNDYIMDYNQLKKKQIVSIYQLKNANFYDKNGDIGLIAIDNTKHESILFCKGSLIDPKKVKSTSRSITRIGIDTESLKKIQNYGLDKYIEKCNEILKKYRKDTSDLYFTAFKGLRSDNHYRRRISFAIAKKIMEKAIDCI